MIKGVYAVCAAAILAAGCSRETHENVNKAKPITENLSSPWNIAVSENEWHLSERTGHIVALDKKTHHKTSFVPSFAKLLHVSGEGGFLGFELHPDYPDVRKGYAYYTYLDGNTPYNTVAELSLKDGRWSETKTLIEKIPAGTIHNGGRIKFGPDTFLYITAGDAGVPENAQNISSLAGKILRISPDGSLPEDNPFPGSAVYSMGHRNPQGIAWDKAGTMYSAEHGQNHYDEINIIESGGNYGWPILEGNDSKNGYIEPFLHSGKKTWAPSGIVEWNGNLYVACLRGEQILKVSVQQKKPTPFLTGYGRMRDIVKDNNTLLALTNNTDGRGVPKKGDDRMLHIQLR